MEWNGMEREGGGGGREKEGRREERKGIPSVSSIHDGHFLLHQMLSHERIIRTRAAVLDQAGGPTACPKMLTKLLKCLSELLSKRWCEKRMEVEVEVEV